ncbi:MAG TPA: ectonucleotide pyrophosphatase/phosphodiesterase [Verrucomicrobiae bacterium]|nr:ectonucleotide pyrophosphatase/phosphodiesterase [Verrucomicrobiae bacterium]
MMQPLRALFLAALFLCAAVYAQAAEPRSPIRRVIIVSIDGLMPEAYVAPDAHGLKIPTLREMAKNGASSDGVRSVFPSITYPAHASIATGTDPGVHGIVTNAAFDPLGKNRQGWRWYATDIRAPTLWDAAQARGLSAALIWWPTTVGARVAALVPEYWRAAVEEDVKLLRALATPGLLEAVAARSPTFAEGFTPPALKDEALTDIAVYAIDALKPHLLMLHLPRVDHEEHSTGPFSEGANAAVEVADQQLARVIAAAKNARTWDETALIVLSDHGFARISRRVRPGALLLEKNLVKIEQNRVVDWKAALAVTAGSAYIYVKDAADGATRKKLLEIFSPLEQKPDSGIRRVYRQEEIRAKGGDPAAFLALEGAEGFEIAPGYRGAYISSSFNRGTHGYDPERPEMLASMVVYGPAIAPGKIKQARLIDVAPTVARWLGLKLERAQGTALPIALRPAPRE